MLAVLFVGAALARERAHRLEPVLCPWGLAAVEPLSDHREQQTVAQAARVHHDLLRAEPLSQTRDGRGAGDDDIRTIGIEPRRLAPLLEGRAT